MLASIDPFPPGQGKGRWSWLGEKRLERRSTRPEFKTGVCADGRFNTPMIYHSQWREGMAAGTERQWSVGSFFSTPLVVDGVVYIGSADGTLYALQ